MADLGLLVAREALVFLLGQLGPNFVVEDVVGGKRWLVLRWAEIGEQHGVILVDG